MDDPDSVMDRSRIIVAIALSFALFSLLVGLLNITVSSGRPQFSETVDSFTGSQTGIARIRIEGVIRDGNGGPGEPGADRLVEQIRQAQDNRAVKGVIISINSPGGSVGATKKIYDAIIKLRREKPVVAVVSDIAASGGYYVASAADQIFAYPGSIIGSIGVIAFHLNISDFLNRYGVRVTAMKAGEFKDASHPFRSMTPQEEQMYDDMLQDAYQQFLNDVSDGRKQSLSIVQTWAEGKIYSGNQARVERLIDEHGGIDKAVEAIKLALNTTEHLPILEPRRDFLEDFFGSIRPGLKQDFYFSPVMYLYSDYPGLQNILFRDLREPGL